MAKEDIHLVKVQENSRIKVSSPALAHMTKQTRFYNPKERSLLAEIQRSNTTKTKTQALEVTV